MSRPPFPPPPRPPAGAEFPECAPQTQDAVGRRAFLELMGASLALAGVTACTRQPVEKIVPYIDAPEGQTPGKATTYATAVLVEGYAAGVLVTSHEGRPTKIEGNPTHPATRGTTSAQVQAEILNLYDPDRSQSVRHAGWPSSWPAFITAIAPELAVKKLRRGAGMRLLTGATTSPTLGDQIKELLARYPAARWHQWEPLTLDSIRAGARLALGQDADSQYHLDLARVIVSLDADLFADGPAAPRHARDFALRRKNGGVARAPNRLYVFESTPSITGAAADHRFVVHRALMPSLAEALATATAGAAAMPFCRRAPPLAAALQAQVDAVAEDLLQNAGAALVVAGSSAPPEIHALCHVMNRALRNVGKTVVYTEPVEVRAAADALSLAALCHDIDAGLVDQLFIIEANPVYTAPADLRFAERLAKVAFRARLGSYEDETSALCHWHVPAAHPLESFGDARAVDGTVTILQPLIAPLYDGKSAYRFLAALLDLPGRSDHDIVKDYWQKTWKDDSDRRFAKALADGFVAGSAAPPLSIAALPRPAAPLAPLAPAATGLTLLIAADPSIKDGTFANNGWLQELAKPLTKIVWDNVAHLAPQTALAHGLENGDVVTLEVGARRVEAPVWILPGQAPDCVTVHLGFGRRFAGRVGDQVGFDAYRLRTAEQLWTRDGLRLTKTGRQHLIATTQSHHSMEGRDLVRRASAAQYRAAPRFAKTLNDKAGPPQSLYPERPQGDGNAWALSIDLSACIGCNACVVACQAENNVPVVGKDQVARGREMAWLRVDRYFEGSADAPVVSFQPVMCMHCENAPCEPVCPVGATVHSSEGLNEMVYNRCVGTRYCSNNCPYKVRRFNFFGFADQGTESLKALRNPNVTVRARGVMEKCTYCVQRLNLARIAAKLEGRGVLDGEVQTACQAACPTAAFTFGNQNDAAAEVTGLQASPLSYELLDILGTRPRTRYLAAVNNPNPNLEKG
ncbi:MAG: 4Fe-4S dicluster domain-containing protein [Deltaproteobacteria bacterium]|nr:4Fe-4S dicluster domain-containing protein [Deltaproteobacteria bacterium]